MDHQNLVYILTIAGMLLIFVEMFVPSGGAIGVIAACCFFGAGYFAFQAWHESNPYLMWTYYGTVALIIPCCIVGAFVLIEKTPLGNRILLAAPTTDEVTPYQREQKHLMSLIGKQGVALNLMTPGGLVSIDGERLHAIAETMMIEANSPVEVVEVRGTRIVVRPVERAESAPTTVRHDAPKSPDEPEEFDPWKNALDDEQV